MTTFSQLVDRVAAQTSRVDLLDTLASYLNLTMRELFSNARNLPVVYGASRVEEQLAANLETGFVWNPAKPFLFQMLETARYDSVLDHNGCPIYPEEVNPGRQVNRKDWFYYRTGDAFAFAGYGGLGSLISLSYFQYVPSLKYYPQGATRPANFDIVDGWTYNAPFDVDSAANLAGQALVTNWLLMRWSEVIEEGLRSKLYKHVGDDARSRISFSLYQNLKTQLQQSEAISSLRQ